MNPASGMIFLCLLTIWSGGRVCSQPDQGIAAADTFFIVPEMVFVAGGSYKMGSTSSVVDERPVHKVILNDFYIGKYEITQKTWTNIMGASDHENYVPGCTKCPVERVSWFNVQMFLKKLNARTGMHFRLPTEAEWEFAARGGTRSKGYNYSGSNNADDVAWRDGNAGSQSHAAGEKKPNELGIHDMSGNVWEWCSDYYESDYYSHSPVKNPMGPVMGSFRVMRGGSWFHDSSGLRVSDRDKANPEFRYGYLGFRICRSAE